MLANPDVRLLRVMVPNERLSVAPDATCEQYEEASVPTSQVAPDRPPQIGDAMSVWPDEPTRAELAVKVGSVRDTPDGSAVPLGSERVEPLHAKPGMPASTPELLNCTWPVEPPAPVDGMTVPSDMIVPLTTTKHPTDVHQTEPFVGVVVGEDPGVRTIEPAIVVGAGKSVFTGAKFATLCAVLHWVGWPVVLA